MDNGIATPHRVRFDVADVVPSTEPLPFVESGLALERNLDVTLVTCQEMNEPVIEGADFHPLIAAGAFAFKQHYPLVISPDMIWITILQGVAQHIQNNAERLR